MPAIDKSKEYEKGLQKLIADYLKKIKQIYHDAIIEVSLNSILAKSKGANFNLDTSPLLKKQIDFILSKMQKDIKLTVINSVKSAWDLSNKKNDQLVNDYIAQKEINKALRSQLYQPNLRALNAFIERTEKGMNLSKRVWKLVKPFQFELEAGLKDGIGKGESAAQIANKLKRYLNEPDRLFRRVRDDNGKLQLSKAAREYHPGQGVYRSSYQNALRLTATETNISYRKADSSRWKKLDFVLGIEIKLSASHVFKTDKNGKLCGCEICEIFIGKYPKDFVFTGWHPLCKCYQQSILMSKEDYNKLLDFKYERSAKSPKVNFITKPPAAFSNYLKNNKARIEGWKNTPYWMKFNPQYVGDVRITGDLFNTSMDMHTVGGKVSPDRQILHDDIVNDIVGKGSTQKGTIYMMGGAPASGKSTLIDSNKIKFPKGILKVDSDEIKLKIPEYSDLLAKGNPNAAAYVHAESSVIGKRVINEAMAKKYDFIADGVGDGEFKDLAAKVKAYQDAGKRVRADYVTLDTELSLKNAAERAAKTGRYVPEEFILKMNSEISKLVPELLSKNVYDEFYLWDNNIRNKPRLILKQLDGKLIIFDSKLYDRFLNKAKYGR